MKKLFTLLVLLVAIVTGAQAQTSYEKYFVKALDGVTQSTIFTGAPSDGGNLDATFSVDGTSYTTARRTSNGHFTISFSLADGKKGRLWAVHNQSSRNFTLKTGDTTIERVTEETGFTATTSGVYADVFDITETGNYTLSNTENIGLVCLILKLEDAVSDGKTNLVGAWTNDAPSFEYGEAATVPTFYVTPTTATPGTAYSVAYSLVSGSNVTVDATNGITAIDTNTPGESVVKATITVNDGDNYKATQTEYETTITVKNAPGEFTSGTLFELAGWSTSNTSAWSGKNLIDTEITGLGTLNNGKAYAVSIESGKNCGTNGSGTNMEYKLGYNSVALKIVLDYALQANDVITITSNSSSSNTCILTTTNSRSNFVTTTNGGTTNIYKVAADDILNGKSEIYIWRTSSTVNIKSINIERPAPSSDPVITADATASINATESGVAATKEIAVEGAHLTGTTLSATLNPAVEGLSVALASDAISDGAITTTATLSYTATANANGTTTLTISDGTTSKEVTVTYISNVVKFTQEDVSEATTWDIMNDVSGSDVNGNYDDIYANIVGLTFADGFNAKSLHVKTTGAYVYRSGNKSSQGAELSFNTTVPGTVKVYFSANGGSSEIYAVVNGKKGTVASTDGGSSGTAAVNDEFEVAAGTVTISGNGTGAIRIYKVVFTPRPASINLTINAAAGATTVYSDYALDFSTLDNVKAYIETGTGDKLSWTQVTTSAPAKTGLLVVSSETNLTVPTAASSDTDVKDNRLKGVATGDESKIVSADDNIYIFTLHDGKPGFIKSETGRSLLVGKAYLDLGEEATGAREFFDLFEDGTTTGISSIDNDQLTTDNDAPAYNLAGQKVGKGYKGIVIINGKKVVK